MTVTETSTKRPSIDLVQAAFDSLSEQVAVLDSNGLICATNQSWNAFAKANAGRLSDVGCGISYLEVCRRAAQSDAASAHVLGLLEQALGGELDHFQLEYPCHSPDEQRWFRLYATSLPGGGLVTSHIEITSRWLAERRAHLGLEVARALSDAESLESAVCSTFPLVMQDAGWRVGTFWVRQSVASPWAHHGSYRSDGARLDHVCGAPPQRDLLVCAPCVVPFIAAHHPAALIREAAEGHARWVVVAPIRCEGETLGALQCFGSSVAKPRPEAQLLLELLAQQLGSFMDRKVAQADFRQLVTHAPDAMLLVSAAGTIVLANHRANALFGADTRPLEGRAVSEFVTLETSSPGSTNGGSTTRLPGVLSKPGGETKALRVDGSTFLAEVSVAPLHGRKGAQTLACVRDLTDRKALEATLAEARKLESLGQLAAGVAHEINTPMQYIGDNLAFIEHTISLLTAELLRLRNASSVPSPTEQAPAWVPPRLASALEALPDALNAAREGIERVTEIVSAMKDFSHPGQERALTCVNAALRSTATVSRSVWKDWAELEWDLDPELPWIEVNPGQINQVFLNLIVNAAHAIEAAAAEGTTRRGKIRIVSRLRDGDVEVTVSDNGCGIAPAIRDRIFDPFFTTKPLGKGTGQGLSICLGVVRGHGGTLTVTSEHDVGTTFRLTLPRSRLDEVG